MRLPLQSGDSDMLVSAAKAACCYHVATAPLARAIAMWCRALLRCFCGKAAVCVRIIEYICPSIMFGTSLGSRHNESPLSVTPCVRLQKALGCIFTFWQWQWPGINKKNVFQSPFIRKVLIANLNSNMQVKMNFANSYCFKWNNCNMIEK